MRGSFDQFARGVMSGERRGVGPMLLRGVLRAGEPFYSVAVGLRNHLFDGGIRRQQRLPRPVVSVGNITTGGTGKTPLVIWLARQLREQAQLRPAILLRGYTVAGAQLSDEQVLLERSLKDVPIIAGADRIASAARALAQHEVDLFILDDGFQHRRVARHFDLVLIDATNPFGYGHLLPRGLLREPLAGLRRASALLITHADEVAPQELELLAGRLSKYGEVYSASHAHGGIQVVGTEEPVPREALCGKRYFAFCGIGNPHSFQRQLASAGGTEVGHHWFGDHHGFSAEDLCSLQRDASSAGADVLVTTAKDAVKLALLPNVTEGLPLWQATLEIRFSNYDDAKLLRQILAAVRPRQH